MFRQFFIFNYFDAALAWYFTFCAYVDKVREGRVTSILTDGQKNILNMQYSYIMIGTHCKTADNL